MGRQTKKQISHQAPAILEQLNSDGCHQLPSFLSQCPKHPFLPLTEINLNSMDDVIQCSKCCVGLDKLYILEILHSPDDFILTNWPKMDSINKELQQVLQKTSESAKIPQKKQFNNMKNSTTNQDKVRDLFANLREKILSTLAIKEEECMKIAARLDTQYKNEETNEQFRKSTIELYLKLSHKNELKEEILKEGNSLQNLQNSIKKIVDIINNSSFLSFYELNNHLSNIKDQTVPLFSLFNQLKQEINCNFDQIQLKEFPNLSPFPNYPSLSPMLLPPPSIPKSPLQFNMQPPALNQLSPFQQNRIVPPFNQQINLNSFKPTLLDNNLKPSSQIGQFIQQKPLQIYPLNLNPPKQLEQQQPPIYLINPSLPVFDEGYKFEILPPPPALSNPKQRKQWSKYLYKAFLDQLEYAIQNKNRQTSFRVCRSRLNFSGIGDSEKSASILAETISCLTELKSLEFEQDSLDNSEEITIRRFAIAISNLDNLRNLNFKFAKIDDKGCIAMASAIASCKLLKALTLGLECNINSDRGLKELSYAIFANKELTDITLYLSGNGISNTGLLYLIGGIATKTNTLESLELYLECQDFEFNTLKTLALLIRDMTKIRKFELEYPENKMEEINVIELKSIIQQSKSLKVWYINNPRS